MSVVTPVSLLKNPDVPPVIPAVCVVLPISIAAAFMIRLLLGALWVHSVASDSTVEIDSTDTTHGFSLCRGPREITSPGPVGARGSLSFVAVRSV